MTSAFGLTQSQYRQARYAVALVLDPDPDGYDTARAELLLDAGFIDLAALGLEGVA